MRKSLFVMIILSVLLVSVWALTACQTAQTNLSIPTHQEVDNKPTATATATPTAAPTATKTSLPVEPTLKPSPKLEICSPLEKISIAEIQSIVSNPFDAPPAGRDDGHHGVDLAFYRFGELTSMQGLAVKAVFPGKVAAIINNRPPYGFAVLIETDLESVFESYPQLMDTIPTPGTVDPHPALYCPAIETPSLEASRESLYLLYAHLNLPPEVSVGDQITCGQVLGEVGTTGMSVNLHLHLEGRVGPAGLRFASLAHYENAASPEEMGNYCLWRVTNTFRMFDPMVIFDQKVVQQ
jgi:murein DD-endopeptidase MepM/ murein hydrolase activator NlpD